jgi:small-conductance mechanosensitive channel
MATAQDMEQKKHATRNAMLLALVLLLLVSAVAVIPIYRPQLAVYVTLLALSLMVALQKYASSFVGYFVLRFSRLFDVGDRIRIGELKGDVTHIGFLHFLLDEVGEGEKFGGELTGRILHIPNHTVLDLPVLNFSQNFTIHGRFLSCAYMFDEVSFPVPPGVQVRLARKLLEDILRQEDRVSRQEAERIYASETPTFLEEADHLPRVMVFMEGDRTVLVGKFVAPVRGRNDLKSTITLRFLEEMEWQKEPAALETERPAA